MGRFLDDRLARPAWSRYGAAAVLVALAALLSAVLHFWLDPVPLAPYFVAVALAAWFGGSGPALMAIALSLAPINLVARPPFGAWPMSIDDWVVSATFVIVSSVLILLSASRDRAEAAANSARARADALAEATRAVSNAELSLDAVLSVIALQASAHVGDLTVVRLVSPDGLCLEAAAVEHPDPAARQSARAALTAECHPVDRGANGAALREGRPQRLDAAALAARRAAEPDLWASTTIPETAALLAVPLRANGRNVGALSVSRAHADHSYTAEDERFLQALADQAALAIERARLFSQIRTDEARLSALIDQLPVGVGLTDDQGRWVLQNPALRGFVGDALPSRDPRAQARWQSWDEQGQPIAPSRWPGTRAFQGDHVAGMDFLYTPDAGKEIWTRVSAAPFRNSDGTVIGVVNVIEDIDARKRSEEALRESENKVRRLFDTGVIGLIFGDAERILEANDRFLQMMHATQDDLQHGRLVWETLTPPEYAERDAAALAEIATRGFCTPFEKEFVRLDGSRVPILIGAAAVNGTSPPWVCAVLDLTTQKAVELDRLAFIDSATHDLRNPLTAVKGRVQLLKRRIGRGQAIATGDIVTGLAAINADADRMLVIINELMDAAHLRFGQALVLDLTTADLVALVRDCVDNISHRTPQSIIVDASTPDLIGTWDLHRIERVVQNLLDNAIKYSFGNGDIVLRMSREDALSGQAWAVLSVQDHGIGIPAADLHGVFDRFRRGGNVGTTAGTGIGLAGAKQIVAQHAGTIVIESVEGQGSTVTVRLPLGPPR